MPASRSGSDSNTRAEDLRRDIDTNLTVEFLGMRAIAPRMAAAGQPP
jgi:NAD(P)-dependent dehydrogenase (short-subunit alcohol dehydrogenase family)